MTTKKTRLVFIHDGPLFYDAEGNYYEFAYHELLQRYSYLADEITFMMRTKPIEGTQKFTLVPKEIKVTSVPNFKSAKMVLKNKPIAEKIIEQCVKINDYIVLRSQSSIAQAAMKYIKKYKKPYIVESVGCSWDSYWNHGLIGKIVAPYMYLRTKSIIKNAPFVYYVTTKFLQSRYPTEGKAVCCSNVVLNYLDETVLEKRINKLKKFDPLKKLIIGTAAALDTRYKGQEHIIRAIPELEKRGYNIEYRLAGGITGPKNNTFLKDLAEKYGVSDRVVFVGSLSAAQMSDFYDAIDLYIQPSKQEGLPRAVIEAMSRGCLVLGTNIAGIPELIQKECLFGKNSDKEVVVAIDRILKMNLIEIAKQNFETALNYDKKKLNAKREKFYDMFLEECRKSYNATKLK